MERPPIVIIMSVATTVWKVWLTGSLMWPAATGRRTSVKDTGKLQPDVLTATVCIGATWGFIDGRRHISIVGRTRFGVQAA